jgi:putative DNA primase/helicase
MAKTARLEAAKSDALQWYAALFGRLEGLEPTEFRLIRGKKILNIWGNLENDEDIKELEDYNNDGYNIYAVVNVLRPETETKIKAGKGGALDADVVAINALFVDLDTGSNNLERLLSLPLPPSLIVRTSTAEKLQACWPVADCPVSQFRALQLQLIALLESDVTCKNESRMMRVPGFWHLKNEPIQSRLIHYDPKVFTLIEILEAFGFDTEYNLHLETPVTVPDGWQPKAGIEKRIFASAQKRVEKVKRENAGRHKLLVWAAFSAFENRLDRAGASGLMAQIVAVMPPRQAGPIPVSEGEAVLDWVYTRTPGKPWDYEEKGGVVDETLSFEQLREKLANYPNESDKALQQAVEDKIFVSMGKLEKIEQGILLQLLKKKGIGVTESKSYIKDAGEDREVLTPAELRDLVLETWHTQGVKAKYIARWQEWYFYENGVYKQALSESVERRVNNILERNGQKVLEYILKDVISKLARSEGVFEEQNPKSENVLNLKNGLLDLDTLELKPHTPDILTFAQTPIDYNPKATSQKFDAFLRRVLPDEIHQKTLQEFAGYSLTPKTFLQKACYLKGAGGTGKGTIAGVLKALLSGNESHGLSCDMNIEDLNDNSPSLGNAVNKRLIYISEVSSKANLIGFKKVVGEDKVVINPKYKRPYDVKLEAKVMITGNTWIHTGEDNANNSIDRRLLILPFNVIPGKEHYNPNILSELTTPEELVGILNWALEGWKRLIENGYRFSSNGDEVERLEFLEHSNPVITFLRERCEGESVASDASQISSQMLYQYWKRWCEGYDYNAASQQFNRWGDEKERWVKFGGSGHHAGSNKMFTAKAEEAFRVLGWKTKRYRTKTGVYWAPLVYYPVQLSK